MAKTPERETVTLFLYLPEKNQVLLSRRGPLERHPHLLQASVHGQIEAGEIPLLAMKREFNEELKGDFHKISKIQEFGENIVGQKTIEKTYYFAGQIKQEHVDELQTTQEVSEFVFVSEKDLSNITPYSKAKKDEGVDYKKNLVMFDDEIEVLEKVFKEYG